MLGLLLLLAAPQAEPTFEQMLLCQSYHEIWQWDEHNAGRKVPEDFEWYRPFRERLHALGKAKGLTRDQIIFQGNRQVQSLRPRLTPEQNADWQKCVVEFGWKPDASGKTIN